MRCTLRVYLLMALLLLIGLPGFAQESECITDYHSDIIVHADSTMTVTETIKVHCLNEHILHGIYRDFPTRYHDRAGHHYLVGFHPASVSRDGNPEPYHTENIDNGVRIYIGNPNKVLSPDSYTYTVKYETDRQLGFFDDHDELFWNVTGNGWIFPIQSASASVTLPPGIPANRIRVTGYTGPQGSNEKDLSAHTNSDGSASFLTTRPLNAYEGLSIVVSFPKGIIKPALASAQWRFFCEDNPLFFLVFFGGLIVLTYFIIVWKKVGKDLPKGTIIPLYTPPGGISPAMMRYLRHFGYDNKAIAAALVDVAVKGYVTIHEEDKLYTIKLLKPLDDDLGKRLIAELSRGVPMPMSALAAALAADEQTVRKTIETLTVQNVPIQTGMNMVRIDPSWHDPAHHENVLTSDELSIVTSLLGQADFIRLDHDSSTEVKTAITAAQASLKAHCEGRFFITNRQYYLPGLLVSLLILAITYLRAKYMGGGSISPMLTPAVFSSCIALVGVNALFNNLLKAPTFVGRKLLDEIEGFRMYLSVAEKETLKDIKSPEPRPELFERYLPYALALDVEQAWTQKFASVLAQASVGGQPYHPGWYYGSAWGYLGTDHFASSLGNSFSSAISSASVPPGSSSGFGGGGFSGGGGGGGGGGGW